MTNAGSNTYSYDSNGIQTTRVIGGQTYTLSYNAENQLVGVTGPSMTASFVYDGGGARVKSTINSTTTYFVGGHYIIPLWDEVTGSQVAKYYFAGAQRVAIWKNGTLSYMLSDHLGSTLGITNTSGTLTAGTLYKAWGETRYTLGTNPTKFKYTGQREESSFGLYFYNARWYDPVSGRFASADTIVPAGVQGLDRYAAMNNNPVRYIDPSGHIACSGPSSNRNSAKGECSDQSWEEIYGISISASFRQGERLAILKAVSAVGSAFARVLNGEAGDLFKQVYGQVNFERCSDCTGFGLTSSRDGGRSHTIYIRQIYSTRDALNRSTRLVVHELGHAFNNALGGAPTSDIPSALLRDTFISGYEIIDGEKYPVYGIEHGTELGNDFFGYAGNMNDWQFGFESTLPANEEFADMFVGWTYNTWGGRLGDTSSLAYQRMQHMATFMSGYLLGR